jgi:hypothetical protein
MSDPMGGGGALVTRIVLTREGAGEARSARDELAGLVQTQRDLAASSRAAAGGVDQLPPMLGRMGGAANESGHGLRIVRTAMAELAFQATGTAGPVGRIAEGLLMFGAGSTTVLGAAAGIGLIAGAYKLASADADAFTHSMESAEAMSRRILASGPHAVATGTRAEAQAQLVDAQTTLARISQPLVTRGRGGAVLSVTPPDAALVLEAQAAVHRWSDALRDAGGAVTKLEGEMGDRLTHAFDDQVQQLKLHQAEIRGDEGAIVRLTAAMTHMSEAQVGQLRKMQRDNAELQIRKDLLDSLADIQGGINLPGMQADIAGIGKIPLLTKGAPDLSAITGAKVPILTKNIEDLGTAIDHLNAGSQRAAADMLSAGLSLIGALRGGPGGLLTSAGGILSHGIKDVLSPNPVAGLVLGLGGALISAFEGGPRRVVIDSYTRKALEQQKEQLASQRNILILDVTATIGDPKRVVYDLARYAARGGSSGVLTTPAGGAVPSRGG